MRQHRSERIDEAHHHHGRHGSQKPAPGKVARKSRKQYYSAQLTAQDSWMRQSRSSPALGVERK